MYNLNDAYTKKFFNKRVSMAWRAPFITQAIISVLQPKSLIDFGCGNGDIINDFIKKGVNAYGVEGTVNSIPALKAMGLAVTDGNSLSDDNRVLINDLRKPIALEKKFDLALSFEVAEHIEEKYTDTFINNLIKASDRILITAAPSGQKGLHHVNCQTQGWWMTKFIKNGYKYGIDEVMKIRLQWSQTGKAKRNGIKLYYKNLLYFYKG